MIAIYRASLATCLRRALLGALIVMGTCGLGCSGSSESPTSGATSTPPAQASVSTPFKAAKVYFRNTDRRMQYMVYTAGGKYQPSHLLPGNYEMRVEAPKRFRPSSVFG